MNIRDEGYGCTLQHKALEEEETKCIFKKRNMYFEAPPSNKQLEKVNTQSYRSTVEEKTNRKMVLLI